MCISTQYKSNYLLVYLIIFLGILFTNSSCNKNIKNNGSYHKSESEKILHSLYGYNAPFELYDYLLNNLTETEINGLCKTGLNQAIFSLSFAVRDSIIIDCELINSQLSKKNEELFIKIFNNKKIIFDFINYNKKYLDYTILINLSYLCDRNLNKLKSVEFENPPLNH